jgi:hypothetical protein
MEEDFSVLYENEGDTSSFKQNLIQNLNGKLVPIDEVDK